MNKRISLLGMMPGRAFFTAVSLCGALLAFTAQADNAGAGDASITNASTADANATNASIGQASSLTDLDLTNLIDIPISTASKYEQKSTEAPASTTVTSRPAAAR